MPFSKANKGTIHMLVSKVIQSENFSALSWKVKVHNITLWWQWKTFNDEFISSSTEGIRFFTNSLFITEKNSATRLLITTNLILVNGQTGSDCGSVVEQAVLQSQDRRFDPRLLWSTAPCGAQSAKKRRWKCEQQWLFRDHDLVTEDNPQTEELLNKVWVILSSVM